ncbi:hypothetical protein [Cutibacterium sp. V970]|uniref:hypothetical protein n=1 Tax=Cutibacterium sp. V970 TaxID=3446481 RepID=UPI003EE17A4F
MTNSPCYLAYFPGGPVLNEYRNDIAEHRIWGTKTIRDAITNHNGISLTEVELDVTAPEGQRVTSVLKQGTQSGHGLAAGKPQFNVQLALRHEDETLKTEDELRGLEPAAEVTCRAPVVEPLCEPP